MHQLDKAEIDRLNLQGVSCMMSNRQEARRLADIVLEAAQAIGYTRGHAYAQINHASLLFYASDIDGAEQVCKPLLERFHDLCDPEGEMLAGVCLGSIATRRGDFALSKQLFDRARELGSQLPDSLYKFSLYSRAGIDASSRGDIVAVPRNFLLALDMAERFGTVSHRVNSLSNLASSQHDLGNDEDAIPLLTEALELIQQDNLKHQLPLVSANLAMCHLAAGKVEAALALVEPFYETTASSLAERAFIFSLAAHASILLGRHENAGQLLAQAQEAALKAEDYEEQMHVWVVKGLLNLELGQTQKALSALKNAHRLLSYTLNRYYQQQIYKGLANINAHLGKWKVAYDYMQQYQSHYEAHSRSARDSRLLMRNLEKEMKNLKEERDRALELQASRESENLKLESLNRELSHQIHHVNSLQVTLKEQAIRDHLTGLYNRRHFETCLNAVLHESSGKFPVAVVIIDLDFFKGINDTYGHLFGDEVLVQFSRLVESRLRVSDMLCRYGGEEFCLLLREAGSTLAVRIIEQIADRFRALTITLGEHSVTGRTFSAGIAEYPRHGDTRHELLMRADTALYVAKTSGRDRLMVAE